MIHRTEIRRSVGPPYTYGAYCRDCGWESYTQTNKRDAENEADGHSIAMSHGDD